MLESKALLSHIFFHTNLLGFFKIQTIMKSHSLINVRGFKLGHFDVFDMLFPISGILKVAAHNFMKSRSHDGLAAEGPNITVAICLKLTENIYLSSSS